jgi:hypothetical protein
MLNGGVAYYGLISAFMFPVIIAFIIGILIGLIVAEESRAVTENASLLAMQAKQHTDYGATSDWPKAVEPV